MCPFRKTFSLITNHGPKRNNNYIYRELAYNALPLNANSYMAHYTMGKLGLMILAHVIKKKQALE